MTGTDVETKIKENYEAEMGLFFQDNEGFIQSLMDEIEYHTEKVRLKGKMLTLAIESYELSVKRYNDTIANEGYKPYESKAHLFGPKETVLQ